MSVNVAACDRLIGVFEQSAEAFEELKNLETAIFETLQESDALAAVEDVILSLTLLRNNPEEAVTEVANMISAAAAVERKSYQNLVTLVANLAEADNEYLKQLPDAVVLRCLHSHTGQTNYFLLQLYNRGLLDIHLLYKFLRVRGTFRLPNLLTFVYFFPELRERYQSWAETEFKTCHSTYRFRSLTYSEDSCSAVEPASWSTGSHPKTKASEIDWEEHKRRRENFFGDGGDESHLLAKYIRENNTDKLIEKLAGTAFDQEIKYDMYDQVTHHHIPDTLVQEVENRYGSTRKETIPIQNPNVIQTICRCGSEECWDALVNLDREKAMKLFKKSANEVIIGGSSRLLELLAMEAANSINDALPTAVKYHRNTEFEWLLEQDNVTADMRSVEAAIQYANFEALEKLIAAGAHRVGNVSRNLFNICGENNAVHMFKYALVRADEVFNPYDVSSTGKNFLHAAALHMGETLVRWWGSKFGNLGFDAVDDRDRNPSHYACIFAVYKKLPRNEEEKAPLELRNRFYYYMSRRADGNYSLETDPTPNE